MVVEVAMIEPKTQVGGVHIILDMKGLSLSHITQFSPKLAQLILEFVQVSCERARKTATNNETRSFSGLRSDSFKNNKYRESAVYF